MHTNTMEAPTRAVRIALNGPTMGTRYAAVFYGTIALPALAEALGAAVTLVDNQMSTWKPDSDLMRFNGALVGEWIALPNDLLHVVDTGLAIGRITKGAFDIGVFDLVRAWGFNDRDGKPDVAEVAALAAAPHRPTYELIELDRTGGRMRKLAPTALDLSGIAKGYGVDRLAAAMEAFGITDYIVSIDGEVRARGRKPDGTLWRVALETPEPGKRDVAGVLELENGALATSGDYRHRVSLGGRSYSHTMDPRVGGPLTGDVQAVTVRAPTCMEADAWATAAMVLGEAVLPLIKTQGMEALIALRA